MSDLSDLDASLLPALSHPLHILIVEDDTIMASWIAQHVEPLREAFPRAIVQIVKTWVEAEQAISADPPPSVTLLDLTLPDSRMHETIARVSVVDRRSPVVIITGQKVEDVESLLIDKQVEVLTKTPDLWESGKIIRAIVRAIERRRVENSRRRLELLDSIISVLHSRGYGPTEQST